MKTRPMVTALVLATVVAAAGEARAQLFGSNRSLGSPLAGRGRATADPSGVGTLSGSERFVRGNRDASDFVGTDSSKARHFVGSEVATSAAAASRLSTRPVRVETGPDANRAAGASSSRASRGGMYSPRLTLGFEPAPRAPAEVSTSLSRQLATSLTSRLGSAFAKDRIRSIEVSLEDGKATLRGTVPSERERTLAALLALFEPGISEVQNQLVVKSRADPGVAPAKQAAKAEHPGPAAASADPAPTAEEPQTPGLR